MADIKLELDADSPQFGQCRCCLSQGYCSDIMSEFLRNGQPESYFNIFAQCFNLVLKTNEGLPTLICLKCVKILQEAYVFRNMVVESELALMKSLTSDHQDDRIDSLLVPGSSQPQLDVNPLVQEAIKVELDVMDGLETDNGSTLSYEEDMDSKDFILPDYATAPVLYDSPSHSHSQPILSEADLLSRFPEGSLRPLPHKRKHFKALSDWTYLRNLDKLRDKEVPAASLEKLLTPPQELSELAKEKHAHVENITALLNNSNATAFNTSPAGGFKYTCFYCKLFYKDFEALKDHQRKKHLKRDARKLVSRDTLSKLVIYAEVSDLKCEICDENLLNLDDLKKHLIETHEKVFYEGYQQRLLACRIVEGSFMCQVCEATFASFQSLERHLTEEHYKYFECHLCHTGFVTSRRLSAHIRMRHSNSYECGCKKIFNSVLNFRSHTCNLKSDCKITFRADKK